MLRVENASLAYQLLLLISKPSSISKGRKDIPSTTLLPTLIFINPSRHIPLARKNRQARADSTEREYFVFRERRHFDFIASSDSVPESGGQLIFEL